MVTRFGPLTKAFCLSQPQIRLLKLCPTCHETAIREGSEEDDCPKYCKCGEGRSQKKGTNEK